MRCLSDLLSLEIKLGKIGKKDEKKNMGRDIRCLKVGAVDLKYFERRKFLKGLVHKEKFRLI